MEDLEKISSYSFENKEKLDKVKKCGCYCCGTIFNPNEIKMWINDRNGKTALCPYCMIDSVIPESLDKEYELNETLLKKLCEKMF